MEEFRGDHAQFERLRKRLRDLHESRVAKSGLLERLAKAEARRLGINAMTRTNIDKYREGTVTRPRDPQTVLALWNVAMSDNFLLPAAPAVPDKAASDHPFFELAVQFFDVLQHQQTRAEKNLLGRFAFYHFSEYLHRFSDALPRAVLRGQWDINLVDGACCVTEMQRYDGKLGRRHGGDNCNGYCLPKGRNVFVILRQGARKIPKIYMLESILDDHVTSETQTLTGHMLKGSEHRKYFRSPVYVERIPKDQEVECNIFRCEDVPEITQELEALERR